jgi:hypothetical protein
MFRKIADRVRAFFAPQVKPTPAPEVKPPAPPRESASEKLARLYPGDPSAAPDLSPGYRPSQALRTARKRERQAVCAFVRALNQGRG